ncbi:MAG: hypothetical protein QY306_04885 [Anaerolineales bacterium]|nr:MAG: hypothetical protein QY306_04885 [Anaerolineales bacterium]
MAKVFYTEQDIDELNARGVTSIDVTENVVITDLALERAMRYEMKINRAEGSSAPKATMSGSVNLVAAYPRAESAGDAELKQRIKSAVLAKLDGQVDAAMLDAVISRVVSSLK